MRLERAIPKSMLSMLHPLRSGAPRCGAGLLIRIVKGVKKVVANRILQWRTASVQAFAWASMMPRRASPELVWERTIFVVTLSPSSLRA